MAPAGLLACRLVAVLEVLLLQQQLLQLLQQEHLFFGPFSVIPKKDKIDQIRTFSNIDGKITC